MDSGVWAAVHGVAESDMSEPCARLRMGMGLAAAVGFMSSEQRGLMYRQNTGVFWLENFDLPGWN